MNAEAVARLGLLVVASSWVACSTKGADRGQDPDASQGLDTRAPVSADAASEAATDTGTDGRMDANVASTDDVDDDLPTAPAAGLSPTPPMGWNSWNTFAGNISDQLIKQVADAIVSSGLKNAGYTYVNIDEGWTLPTRAADGSIQPGPNFPNGIQPIADYVHQRGLKLGIYSDRGVATCGCSATCGCQNGSFGREAQDALSYASWGVDYVKYDNCCPPTPDVIQVQYQAMRDGINAAGRPMVYSLCAWQFWEWGVTMGDLWRTTSDITPTWASFFGNVTQTRYLAAYAGPNRYFGAPMPATARYGWNDPDMLEVGRGMTDVEDQSHFSLWAITAAPLIAGNDPRAMSVNTKTVLTNAEVVAIDQDALGLQGVAVRVNGNQSVWAKPLNASGVRAVVLSNGDTSPADIPFGLPEIGLRPGSATLRDLVAHADLAPINDKYTASVPPHGTVTLKVTGTEPPRPFGTAYLSDLTSTYSANGLGPVHKDESNSSSAPTTGTPISIRGKAYPKGLGVDGPSLVIYRLAKKCTSFTADVGVDDVAHGGGSVVFQVWADGELLFDSNVMTGTSPVQSLQVSLTGKRRLKLLVTNGGDGNALDRADWADAKVVCAP